MRRARRLLAGLVWVAAVAAALVLGGATLAMALNGDQGPARLDGLFTAADRLALGVLTVERGVWESSGREPEVKNALVNWGLAAAAWLFAGGLVSWLVRPSRATSRRPPEGDRSRAVPSEQS